MTVCKVLSEAECRGRLSDLARSELRADVSIYGADGVGDAPRERETREALVWEGGGGAEMRGRFSRTPVFTTRSFVSRVGSIDRLEALTSSVHVCVVICGAGLARSRARSRSTSSCVRACVPCAEQGAGGWRVSGDAPHARELKN